MDFEEAATASGLVRPEHLKDLLRSLKNRTFSWIVCDPCRREERLQGDLVLELPVAIVALDGNARCKGFTAMMINNACDLQPGRSQSVTVAPLQSFDDFARVIVSREPEKSKNYLEHVQANRIDELMYIPSCPQLPNGAIVRFDRLSSMSARVYDRALEEGRRVASLTQTGFYYLLMKLTRFLARPESTEIQRDLSS